jgi:hypothetical protein
MNADSRSFLLVSRSHKDWDMLRLADDKDYTSKH